MSATVVRRITLYPLSIPLRQSNAFDSEQRVVAARIVVAVELQNGIVGYGETDAETSLTGETRQSILAAIQSTFVDPLMSFHPPSMTDALESVDELPWQDAAGRSCVSARTAVELALIDAAMQSFNRGMETVGGWLDLRGFAPPGSLPSVRFSAVIRTRSASSLQRLLRRAFWRGFQHYKLYVGFQGDLELVAQACRYLAKPLANRKATFRIDAGGAWSLAVAKEWIARARDLPIAGILHPLQRATVSDMTSLHSAIADAFAGKAFAPLLIHGQSVTSPDDTNQLIGAGAADAISIRITRCGGLLPALRLADHAVRANAVVQLGSAHGETSILTAAALRFLEVCPNVVWAEGCEVKARLETDVATRPLQSSFGGRPPRLAATGLGTVVDANRLTDLCETVPIVLTL